MSYARCCRPLHRGERAADAPEALMRSRYAAFAEKQHAYLWATLHPAHEDRALGEASALAAIQDTAREHRYVGLAILGTAPEDEAGIARVLFHARVFRKGVDMSFVELSDFAREGEGGPWRYLRGDALPARDLPSIADLTIDGFRARLAAR
jgi:SEC-C motif-containing protein